MGATALFDMFMKEKQAIQTVENVCQFQFDIISESVVNSYVAA
jgi:hypothetical protein